MPVNSRFPFVRSELRNFGFVLISTPDMYSPIFLTTFHLVFATIGTRILARTTHLLDGLQNVQVRCRFGLGFHAHAESL